MRPESHAEQALLPLREFLIADDVNEIVVNPDGRVWIEAASQRHMREWRSEGGRGATVTGDALNLKTLGAHLAGESKNQLGPRHPIVSGRINVFGQSVRIQVVVPPAIELGVSVAVRKYISRLLPMREIRFLGGRQSDLEGTRQVMLASLGEMAERGDLRTLIETAVAQRLNILVSGGTSSGKTTLAQGILSPVDRNERMVTIEDAPELHLPHPNTVGLVADRRSQSERSPARLLEAALRMRPDRLILGEVRGAEAYDFLEAINTGHPGSISTIHADTPALALERLAMMVMRAGMNQSRQDVLEYATKTIHLIIQVGRRGGERGVMQVMRPAAFMLGDDHQANAARCYVS